MNSFYYILFLLTIDIQTAFDSFHVLGEDYLSCLELMFNPFDLINKIIMFNSIQLLCLYNCTNGSLLGTLTLLVPYILDIRHWLPIH